MKPDPPENTDSAGTPGVGGDGPRPRVTIRRVSLPADRADRMARMAKKSREQKVLPEPNSQTLANTVAIKIRKQIVERKLAEDDLFMTEAQLAERFSVSRNIAREAVSRLRALGVLKSRQSKGLIVGRSDPVLLLEHTLPFYNRTDDDLCRLAQLRYTLEVGAIEMAASNASEDQIEKLRALAMEYQEESDAASQHTVKAMEIELDFHCLILAMTGNTLIAGMHQVIVTYFQTVEHDETFHAHTNPFAMWQHRAIAEAIAARDAEQARALLRMHLGGLRDPAPVHAGKSAGETVKEITSKR